MEAVKFTKVEVQELSYEEAIALKNAISEKFLDTKKDGRFLWDRLLKYKYSSCPNCWRWISSFIGDEKAIMFFIQSSKPKAFWFPSGDAIVDVFGETGGFDMYITNKNTDYFLAYSHHDILYACGSAEKWLENYTGKVP